MLSIVLFCICVSLLSYRICVTTFGHGFAVLLCFNVWELVVVGQVFGFCELCRSCPFMVMVSRREFKKIKYGIIKGVIILAMLWEKKAINVF